MAWRVYMCPVETEAAFQSSLGPFTVNKHKRASREGRRTGSHLINLQTRLQIREAHAFITVEVLGMSPLQSREAVYGSSGHSKESGSQLHIRSHHSRQVSAWGDADCVMQSLQPKPRRNYSLCTFPDGGIIILARLLHRWQMFRNWLFSNLICQKKQTMSLYITHKITLLGVFTKN